MGRAVTRSMIGVVVMAAALAAIAAPASALQSAVAGLQCAPGQPVTQTFTLGQQSARTQAEYRALRFTGAFQATPGGAPAAPRAFRATIPVVFHVIAENRTAAGGWVTDRQVRDQIAVLNRAFAGGYGGVDTGFRFTLRRITRTVNPDWYFGLAGSLEQELEVKRALKEGGPTTLNVYTGAFELGYAYLPSIVTDPQFSVLDGVVIHPQSMPGGSIEGFNVGHTLTHETGHYLGLLHTFDNGCGGGGDFVSDTPAERVPTSGCPEGKDTCPQPGQDPIHNYMDYSTDPCYTMFTSGQRARMQQQYLYYRKGVYGT